MNTVCQKTAYKLPKLTQEATKNVSFNKRMGQ